MEKIALPIAPTTATTMPLLNENKENNNAIIHTNTNNTTATTQTKLANSDSNSNDGGANAHECENTTSVDSNAPLRPLFKKSNTCGSLFARCACKSSQHHLHQPPHKPLSQSYSHPDTTIIFTDDNKYASNVGTTRHQPQPHVINTRNGEQVELSHPANHRFSSPNIEYNHTIDFAVHPEILVKKANSFKERTNDKKITRSILKKSSQSFPGFAARRPSNLMLQFSLEESTDNEDDNTRRTGVVNDHDNDVDSNGDDKKSFYVVDDVLEQDYQWAMLSPSLSGTTPTGASSYGSDDLNNKNNLEYLKYSALTYQRETAAHPVTSAEDFFKESGILGPMGGGVSALLRKTSKIAPVTSPTKEKIRRNSQIMTMSKHQLEHKRKSITDDVNFNQIEHHVAPDDRPKTLEEQVEGLKQLVKSRDAEINKLKREIHKLKSVLQQTTPNNISLPESDLLSSLQSRHGLASQKAPKINTIPKLSSDSTEDTFNQNLPMSNNALPMHQLVKKTGVSGETHMSAHQSNDITIPKHEKDFRSKHLIKEAILDNDFLKYIDSLQVRELVEAMHSLEISEGQYVIREGDAGAHLYVSAEGEFQVIKEGNILGTMGPRKAFGELAILYDCKRTASIRATCDSKVWVLDRKVFQQIMMKTGMQRIEENVNFLKSVPLLKNLNNDVLTKIADVLEVEFYPAGAYIIRQGASGDTFFLISQGNVKVTQRIPTSSLEEDIRILGRGEYFGEQALIKEDKRTANIIAMSPGVECLTLDRDSFRQHIGDLCELHEKDYGDEQRVLSFQNCEKRFPLLENVPSNEYAAITLDDFDVIATLGIGGFGRVELVRLVKDTKIETFALKCMKKQHIVETHQEEHVHNERKIMLSCTTPFICRLYRTFRDSKYIYMMLEPCMGGEVWTILRDRGTFNEYTTQFIIGCVLQAFEYLHARGIVYRDLKPENLMLDAKGYVKLVDFGFAKFIGYSSKTWTFCGTPEYVAPEIILNKGHDRAVDYWALGVLIHELLTGTPPFTAADPMKTYNIILKGIDMIDFPRHMPRAAISLIKKLCRDVPAERFGYQKGGIQNIKKHKWFQGFDWDGLASLSLMPPIIRKVAGPYDTHNFDRFANDIEIPPDETSGWDAEF